MTSVVFVHGLGNKPEPTELLRIWQRSLGRENGIDLNAAGIDSYMVYWANVFYPSPDPDIAKYESTDDLILSKEQEAIALESEVRVRAQLSSVERAFLDGLAEKYDVTVTYANSSNGVENSDRGAIDVYERIPLPDFLKELVMARFVKEAYAYIFDKESSPIEGKTYKVRAELRERFISTLKNIKAAKPNEPIVVISHSMGTMIAYDCLKCVPDCPNVDWLLTIGSPLGIDEIQDGFAPVWSRENGYPHEKLTQGWINIYDPLDVVARLDPNLANDYQRAGKPVIRDIAESNWGAWRHSISKYFQGKELRSTLRQALEI
jgi:pimeloyl-ACP methyl ester carboxylesterase